MGCCPVSSIVRPRPSVACAAARTAGPRAVTSTPEPEALPIWGSTHPRAGAPSSTPRETTELTRSRATADRAKARLVASVQSIATCALLANAAVACHRTAPFTRARAMEQLRATYPNAALPSNDVPAGVVAHE